MDFMDWDSLSITQRNYIDELENNYKDLKKRYDELNDFNNSQCAKLLKGNAELKCRIEKQREIKRDYVDKCKQLEEQIEKMKCCGNCKHFKMDYDYSVCDNHDEHCIFYGSVCDKWELDNFR